MASTSRFIVWKRGEREWDDDKEEGCSCLRLRRSNNVDSVYFGTRPLPVQPMRALRLHGSARDKLCSGPQSLDKAKPSTGYLSVDPDLCYDSIHKPLYHRRKAGMFCYFFSV
jgi:hypothetical protein